MYLLDTDTLSLLHASDPRLQKQRDQFDIAAIALAHGATVVTRNLRHLRQIPGLGVENWIE
jgi:predicted nucleic acid-binding protein